MVLEEQNIMFVLRATQQAGTENVVLQLCEFFKPLVNKIVVVAAEGFNKQKLEELGGKYYAIPDIENKSPKTVLNIRKTIKRIAKEENITVIHTQHRMAAFYVRFTGLYKKCVFINTSHNTFFNRKALTRYAYKHAKLIACGEMVKKNLEDVFGLSDVTVIHNAVKPFDSEVVTDETISKAKQEGKFTVGNIGRLSEQKGMEYFINAVPDVIAAHPDTEFFIVGSGEDEAKLKEMAKDLPVTFLGYRTDVQNIMSQLDLVVLSSLWEGLPLTPIEAFSVGKTIVATAVDGTVEIVKDGYNGLLVKAGDAKAIAEKINWMIVHPDDKKKMEATALDTFNEEFSFDTLAKTYIDYYRSI